jgi:hypothetical protein
MDVLTTDFFSFPFIAANVFAHLACFVGAPLEVASIRKVPPGEHLVKRKGATPVEWFLTAEWTLALNRAESNSTEKKRVADMAVSGIC